jgi:DNA invertase Pin-like site-specific DNA recombinase
VTTVGYARVSSTGQDLSVQLEKLAGCDKVFKEKRSGVDTGRPELRRCLEYLREGDTLLVTKIDRLARSTSDLYRIISELAEKGAAFKVVDDNDRHHVPHRQAGDGHSGVDCRIRERHPPGAPDGRHCQG